MKLLLIVALVQRCKLNLRTHTRRGRARVRRRLGGRVHTHRVEQVVRRLPRDDALVRTFMNATVSASLATTRCAGAEVRARHRRDDVRSLRAGEQAQARGRLDGDGRALAEGYRDDTHRLIHEDVERRGGSAGWPAKDALTVSHSNARRRRERRRETKARMKRGREERNGAAQHKPRARGARGLGMRKGAQSTCAGRGSAPALAAVRWRAVNEARVYVYRVRERARGACVRDEAESLAAKGGTIGVGGDADAKGWDELAGGRREALLSARSRANVVVAPTGPRIMHELSDPAPHIAETTHPQNRNLKLLVKRHRIALTFSCFSRRPFVRRAPSTNSPDPEGRTVRFSESLGTNIHTSVRSSPAPKVNFFHPNRFFCFSFFEGVSRRCERRGRHADARVWVTAEVGERIAETAWWWYGRGSFYCSFQVPRLGESHAIPSFKLLKALNYICTTLPRCYGYDTQKERRYSVTSKRGAYFEITIHAMPQGNAMPPISSHQTHDWHRRSAALRLDDRRIYFEDSEGGTDYMRAVTDKKSGRTFQVPSVPGHPML
ncbi:hypothetical protein DFH09DRAFT_1088441 [Mycena vulgaris]|nr:hypothetical protein DFH09DRAFT_1088441 [Mycena vulgaris]